MFARAKYVLKDGVTIVEDGEVVAWTSGHTLELTVESDKAMVARSETYLQDRFGAGLNSFAVPDEAFTKADVFEEVACLA